VAPERMRRVMGLTVVGAALLAGGVMLVLVGSALHLKSPHEGRGFVHAGEAAAICGLACGVGLLVVLIMDLADRAGRGGAGKGSGPQPASGGLTPLPPPETDLADLRQEPVVEFRLASRYARPDYAAPDAGNGPYPPAAANAPYPNPGSGPDPQAGGSWNPGPASAWGPRDDWDSSAEAGWSVGQADHWAGDGRGGWSPPGQGDWGQGGQQDQPGWAAAGQGAWGQGGWGQDRWGSPGPDNWSQGGQQQWAPDGRGGWVRAGQGGWGPAGQGDWGQGGQQAQQAWAAAGQDEWTGDGRDGWGAASQGDWGQGGQQDQPEWSATGQGGWVPPGPDGYGQGGQQQWASDGRGGWVPAEQDNWSAPGQGGWGQGGPQDQPEWAAAGPGDLGSGGVPEWAPGGQGGWVAGADHDWGTAEPAASRPQVTPDPPRATPNEAAPDVVVTKPVEAGDTGALDDTAPIPVIRDVSPPAPKTAEDEPASGAEPGANQPAPPSVFEPAPKKSVFEPAPRKSVFEPGPKKGQERDRGSERDGHPDDAGRRANADPLPAETQAKLEQIKDLYMTAEAIGEDALVKHFDQLSQRQRSLIREFFEQSGLGSSRASALLGDDGTSPPNGDSTQDGASLPG